MKRQFDAACRQYQVKEAGLENLWTTDRTWPLAGGLYLYDYESQTYIIPASTTQYNHTVTICMSHTPIPSGTPVSMTLFFDSGRVEYNTEYPFWIGGCNYNFSVASGGAVPEFSVECPESTNLAGMMLKSTSVTTHPVDFFCFFIPGTTVTETLQFRVMLVIGDTPAETFKPHGIHKHAWTDGLKSGLPSVKLLGKTEQAANPTPETPQDVRGNNATLRSCGKNLFNPNWVNGAHDMLTRKGNEYGYKAGTELVANMGLYNRGVDWHDGQHFYTIPKGNWKVSAEFWIPSGLKCISQVYMQFHNIGLGRTAIEKYQSIPIETWTKVEVSFSVNSTNAELFSGVSFRAGGVGDKNQYTNLGVRIRHVELMRADDVSDMFTPYYDGGEATAPTLMCAVDGSCQSTYDPQTGEFVNWWWERLTFNGTEAWSAHSPSLDIAGFYLPGALPEAMYENACWSNQTAPQIESPKNPTGAYLVCGLHDSRLRAYQFGFYDDTLPDKGLANWKAHLAAHPLEVWVARNEPEITNIGAQRLTCPTGYGQIIQAAGDISDCPMEVRYLSHGGHVK